MKIYQETFPTRGPESKISYHGRPAGPFTRNGFQYQCSLADVDDGLSNTIFFGEQIMDCNGPVRRGWSRTNNDQGFIGTLIPINHMTCNLTSDPCNTRGGQQRRGFRSRHPGGANFLFGDGAIHFLPESLDEYLYCYLGDMGAGHNGKVSNLPE